MVNISKVTETVPSLVQSGKKVIAETVEKQAKPNITDLDRFNTRTYLHGKSLDFQTTPAELKALFKFEGDEFFYKAYEFMVGKLRIPQVLRPQVVDMPMNENFRMAYNTLNNILIRNKNYVPKDKNEIFGLIRHELQHFLQNANVLRTEGIGEQAIEMYPKLAAKQRTTAFDYEVKNLTLEQLKPNYNEEAMQYYKQMKDLLKSNPEAYEAELKDFTKVIEDTFAPQYQNFRNLVIQEMGVIKADTKAANRSKKILDEMLKEHGYFKEDGTVHIGQYTYDLRENEAVLAEDFAKLKLQPDGEKFCYIKNMKQKVQELGNYFDSNKNTTEVKDFIETAKEKAQTFTIKDLISYLYD